MFSKTKCIFMFPDKRIVVKWLKFVDGKATTTFDGKECMYLLQQPYTIPVVFKSDSPIPFCKVPQYFSMYNTNSYTYTNVKTVKKDMLLDIIKTSGAEESGFILVSKNAIVDSATEELALSCGFKDGEYFVFTVKSLEELKLK
jgi:hypothetical protein